jgi:hypothetical protein
MSMMADLAMQCLLPQKQGLLLLCAPHQHQSLLAPPLVRAPPQSLARH